MSDRWQLGSYTFTINPNKYGEQITYVGDNALTLNGTLISMPTVTQEQYNFTSTLWQPMPRILNQVSIPNGSGVKVVNSNYYILNNVTKNVDVYNSNFGLVKSVNILSGNANLLAFDVEPNGTILAVDNSGTQFFYTIPPSGSATKTTLPGFNGVVQGIKFDNSNMWLVTNNNILYKTDLSFNILGSISLPNTSNYLGYRGMTIAGNFLVLSFNNSDTVGALHIDRATGSIINEFGLPSYTPVLDVAYDGTNYIFLTQIGSQLLYTNGNTLHADIYVIENNIKNNGFLYMIDDMGIKRKVTVSSYQIDRVEGYLTMYNIQLQVDKIDRG